jgi:curved DNA-binding protein CbpA
MSSPVRALSNHYETLQVSQSATTDEIVRSFASLMRAARMRPDISVGRLAKLSVAYETLRDPAKRRTYDASIGLARKPAATSPTVSPFMGSPVIDRLNRIAERSPDSAPEPRSRLATETRGEPRVAAFIAASLRARSDPPEAKMAEPISKAETRPPARPATDHASAPADELMIEEGRWSIGRTGATLTAGVIGVAFLAFAAASSDRNSIPVRSAEAEPGLTVPLPPATSNNVSLVPTEPVAAARPAGATPSPRLQARAARVAPPTQPRTTSRLLVIDNEPAAAAGDKAEGQSMPAEAAAQQSSGEPPAAETSAAAAVPEPVSAPAERLPLASSTIARTIERIGYGCGRVVSETAVEGSAGVFTITCSSGDTYRAAPVRGRYRFRRTGSQ